MFVSLVAEVEILQQAVIPLSHGEAMHSELLRRVSHLDAGLAAYLHGPAAGQTRPYTLSGLQVSSPDIRDRTMLLRGGSRGWFRLTAIGELQCQALLSLADSSDDWQIAGDGFFCDLDILRWCEYPEEHPWAGTANTDDLMQSAETAAKADRDTATLLFHSPTSFEERDRGYGAKIALPIPRLVFGSVKRRAFQCGLISKLENDALNRVIEQEVALDRFESLSFVDLEFRRHGFDRSGFTGTCTFAFNPRLGMRDRVWLHLLANLAFYSGMGSNTSQSMGQVRRKPSSQFTYQGR